MKTIRKWDCLLRGAGVGVWATVGLLLVSLALRYKAWLVHEQAEFGEIVFWLFLAAWGKALAIGVFGFFLILVIIRALKTCHERKDFPGIGGRREHGRENVRMRQSLMMGQGHTDGARHS